MEELNGQSATVAAPRKSSLRLVAHLAASPFLGGPERQMLGLAASLPPEVRTVFLAFTESGRARPFLDELGHAGVEAVELRENAPRYRAAVAEVTDHLKRFGAEVLLCHGYKPDILGLAAARRAGVPVVAVARGWTAATLKVRLNEAIDRLCLRRMDRVVCVSEGQAAKVRRAGERADRVVVIGSGQGRPRPAVRARTLRLRRACRPSRPDGNLREILVLPEWH